MATSAVLLIASVFTAPSLMEAPVRNDELIPALIASLDDADGEVRRNIAAALANLGDAAVPSLIEALTHSSRERKMGAAIALGRIRPPVQAAVPALLKAMKDKDELLRREVSYALSRIVGKQSPISIPAKPVMPPLDPTPGAPRLGGSQ